MRRWNGTFLGVLVTSVPALGVGINYHEHWDSYATGLADPVYNQVWTPDPAVLPNFIEITTITPFTTPNSLLIDARNRALNNSLADGVSNVGLQPGNPAAEGVEMNPGEYVIPGGDLGDAENLILRYDLRTSNVANARQPLATYAEISKGDVHAPFGAGSLDVLAEPIPVLAIGTINDTFTTSDGSAPGSLAAVFVFNGQQWFATSAGLIAGTYNQLRMDIYFNPVDSQWEMLVRNSASSQTAGPYVIPFDPSAAGFDAISVREFNSGKSWSGTSVADDLYLVGGRIVPEPAAAALLALSAPLVLRRRRAPLS